jgi:signal transduction histidine kinase
MLITEYDDFSEKERKDIIANVDNAVNSTFKLLNNMLTWSMSQLNAIEINKEKLQLSEIVNESIEPYLNKAELKEISVSNVVADDVYIDADKFTISTVIGNLTNNAIKFTSIGGKVKIAAELSEDNTKIIISDTGIGMNKDTMSNLLKPGKNSSTPGTNQEKGTGLGLIITNDFIKLNNGKIRIESELGKGSTFIVSLPHND